MNKKLLVVGYFGFQNFGDDVMLRNFINAAEDYEIRVLIAGQNTLRIDLRHENTDVIETLDGYFKNLREQIKWCDQVLWVGGTCFYGSISQQFFLLRLILACRWSAKRIKFLSVGLGKFKNKLAHLLGMLNIRLASRIYWRDKKSLHEISKYFDNSNFFLPDLFLLKAEGEKNQKQNHIILALNKKYIALDHIDCMLDHLLFVFDVVHIVALNGSPTGDDAILREIIGERAKSCRVKIHNYDVEKIEGLFSTSRAFIGYRLHGLLAAACCGSAFYCVNYAEKIEKAFAEYDFDTSRLIDGKLDLKVLRTFDFTECKPLTISIFKEELHHAIEA